MSFATSYRFAAALALGATLIAPVSAKAPYDRAYDASNRRTEAVLEVIKSWPAEGRSAALRMIAQCGQPTEITETRISWSDSAGNVRCNPRAAGVQPEDVGDADVATAQAGMTSP